MLHMLRYILVVNCASRFIYDCLKVVNENICEGIERFGARKSFETYQVMSSCDQKSGL